MRFRELKRRKPHFKEFGDLLVRRHGQNYYSSYHNHSRVTVDQAAVRFGRYLRAARVNGNMSIAELATQTKISQATLTALEHGLILACDIKPRWLKGLAAVLNENAEDFNMLLGRKISTGSSGWLTKKLLTHWQNWFAYSKRSLLASPMYVTCSVALFCFLVGAALFLNANYPAQQPMPTKHRSSLAIVGPEQRLNIIKAEYGIERQVLVLPASFSNGNSCCIY